MSPLKRKLTFLIVVAAVAASAAGAYAATQASSSTSPRQAFLNDIAHRLHVTPAQLKKAVDGAYTDRLSALVAAGRLSKAQAKAIEKGLSGAGSPPGFWLLGGMAQVMHPGLHRGWFAYSPGAVARPNAKLPPQAMLPPAAVPGAARAPFPLLPGPGFGLLLPGRMKAAFSYLGIRPAKLMADLRAGKSLAQIAKAQGKTTAGLESAVAASIKARLNRRVAAKQLSQTEATRIMKAIDARIAAVMNLHVRALPGRMRAYDHHGWGRFNQKAHHGWGHFDRKPHDAVAPSSGPALWPA